MTFKNKMLLAALSIALFLVLGTEARASKDAAYRHNEEGLKRAKAGDLKGAIEELRKAHRYAPEDARINKNLAVTYNNYAFSLMKKGDYAQAAEYYEYAISYEGENAFALYNAAQAYYKLQNIPKAREYLGRALRVRPDLGNAKLLMEKIEREAPGETGFDRFETPHFTVASSGDVKTESFTYIKTYLEEAYGKVGSFLDHYPRAKVVTILYSEGSYRAIMGSKPEWAMAIFDGKLRIPTHKFSQMDLEIVKVIYHEYAHVLIYSMALGRSPRWLSEGIAGKAEDLAGPRSKDNIRPYLERYGLVPISSIPEDFSSIRDENEAVALYIESYLIVDYLIAQKGPKVLTQILTELGNGRTIDEAFRMACGIDIATFERAFRLSVESSFGVTLRDGEAGSS